MVHALFPIADVIGPEAADLIQEVVQRAFSGQFGRGGPSGHTHRERPTTGIRPRVPGGAGPTVPATPHDRCVRSMHHQTGVMSHRRMRDDMHTVSVSKTVDASPEEVWAVLDDFGSVSKYNPNVETSGIVDGPETGVGATRECVFYDGGRVEERITAYESGSGYTVDFVDIGGMPLRRNVVDLAVEELEEGRTVVTMTATFTPKYGPLGWLMAKAMMGSRFRETFEAVLDGLESHVLTGRYVGPGGSAADAASD